MRIAVVGSGIAGLGAAYALSHAHEVEVFEREDRAGGHTNTLEVLHDGRPLALDTGFIVHNERNYPHLVRLFRELGVRTQASDMSFSVSAPAAGLEYCGSRLWAQPHNLSRPLFVRLMVEIVRFLRSARGALDGRYRDATLGQLARAESYSTAFRDLFLVPLTAAIWSTAPVRALEFPAEYALRFFDNHGLLGFRRHRWRTVTGGARTYVHAIAARLGGGLHLGTPVRELRRDLDGVALRLADGSLRRFDAAVVATHAHEALALLGDPSVDERRVLGAFTITVNEAVLHTDERLLPRRAPVRASWNYRVPSVPDAAPAVTYYLNRLQALDVDAHYCVTLNQSDRIRPERVIRRLRYAHPLYTFDAIRAQSELPRIDGVRRTWFAGAWQGFGFHEDGLASGLRAARGLGVEW